MQKLADIGALFAALLRQRGVLPGAALIAVAAAFVGNALYLQPRPHPSPLFATRGEPEPPQVATDPLVRAVQEALARTGLYTGAVDGITGPQTKSAILAFQKSTGREPTGEASVDLLTAILAASKIPELQGATQTTAATPIAPPETSGDAIADLARAQSGQPAAANQSHGADPLVASVQNALALSAYGPLTADGVVGPDTREAIMRFQRDHDLPVTGEISDGLVIELRAAGAMHDG